MQQKVVTSAAAAPVIDTSDMDPELARYLNRNYWQQKSVELKSSAAATTTVTQPSAPAIAAADTKVSTAGGGGLNSATAVQPQQNADDEVVTAMFCCCTHTLSRAQLHMLVFGHFQHLVTS